MTKLETFLFFGPFIVKVGLNAIANMKNEYLCVETIDSALAKLTLVFAARHLVESTETQCIAGKKEK
ncbi:MAG: hypothetical protein ACRCYE_09205 [Sarcina sp.]